VFFVLRTAGTGRYTDIVLDFRSVDRLRCVRCLNASLRNMEKARKFAAVRDNFRRVYTVGNVAICLRTLGAGTQCGQL
jgi:hypothetical protein